MSDGVLEGLFGFGSRGVGSRQAIGIMVIDGFEGGAPGPQGLCFIVLNHCRVSWGEAEMVKVGEAGESVRVCRSDGASDGRRG